MKPFTAISMVALLVSVLTSGLAMPVHAMDVRSKNSADPHYIKVTHEDLGSIRMVSFELCTKDDSYCDVLGPSQYYELNRLFSQQTRESLQIAGAVGADVAALYLLVKGGGALGVGLSLSLGMGYGDAMVWAVGGALAGAAGAGTLVATLDPINPVVQYRQRRTIDDAVILDEEVVIKGSVADFAERLEVVLNKLD